MTQKLRNTQAISISNNSCPFCKLDVDENLGDHIKNVHGEDNYNLAVLKAKEDGIPDPKIGELFRITFKQLEKIITEAYGINITSLKKPKKVKHWEPKEFKPEATTVWSYRRRGDWATHDSRYRANWSPYIPRNIILRYTKPGETVLDYFAGGGTTAIEAKLLGRKCIVRDINPAAIGLTKNNLRFDPPTSLFVNYPMYEPKVSVGDATHLRGIKDIDLICSHPPYAGIIKFGSKVRGDLSGLNYEDFIKQMQKVATKSYSLLKSGGKCVILIGDTRQKKHVIPMGFRTINVFLDAKFKLKELIIKRQHNCKTTGFWYTSSIKHNFLLLAHEYLAVFEKPPLPKFSDSPNSNNGDLKVSSEKKLQSSQQLDILETTTVWVSPDDNQDDYITKNLVERYSDSNDYIEVSVSYDLVSRLPLEVNSTDKVGLLFIKSPCLDDNPSSEEVCSYINNIQSFVGRSIPCVKKDGFLVIQTRDVRIDGYIEPLAKKLEDTVTNANLWLKEIIIVTKDGINGSPMHRENSNGDLEITHQYLLVYEVLHSDSIPLTIKT